MSATKPTCRGTGTTMLLAALPSSLVDCPVCGRRNLGALNVRGYDGEVFRGGDVPPHTPAPPSAADAVRATSASGRHMRSEDERHAEAVRRWYDSKEWER